ncbi:hypothetical protein [Frankia sp. AvcI1]|uniref:hypothetical protein n=1 Tax=Frankia sp. AvcI1 TaxID=573496 RepID=UPI0021183142|nr:hypothetical protein [Frankia sp. AvcI1]
MTLGTVVARMLAGLDEPWNGTGPRRNVICIHGGDPAARSRQSEVVQREAHARRRARTHTVRIDVAAMGRDPERYLLALRAGLQTGPTPTGDLPVFDAGLLIYWARRYPTVSLAQVVTRRTVLGPTTARLRAARALADPAWTTPGDMELPWPQLAETPALASLRQQCPVLDQVVTGRLDQALPLLPNLLGWDLQRQRQRSQVEVTVVLEAVDAVRSLWPRLGDLEDVIVCTAADLPALIVVTSQSPVDWASPQRALYLHHHGAARWPGLLGSGPDSDLIDAAEDAA